MQLSTLATRSRATVAFAVIALLCIIFLGESFKVLASTSTIKRDQDTHQPVKRNWESESSPFSGPPDDLNDDTGEIETPVEDAVPHEAVSVHDHTSAADGDNSFWAPKLSLPIPLPIPIATPLSIIASIFGGHGSSSAPVPGNPTLSLPGVPTPTGGAGGGMFGSVLSILAGSPTGTSTSGGSGGNVGPLGGLLSALSQAAPSPGITSLPTATTGPGDSSGPLAGLNVLGGVASALDGVLGGSEVASNDGGGLMGQLSAHLLDPLSSIAADPAAILADPTAALNKVQSQVSAVLDGMPSAMAAGLQLASNVGGDLAEALNATTNVLETAPEVAGGVADKVGSLLNAGPALATGLPAAAMAAVDKIGGILNGIPGIVGTATGLLDEMKDDLSYAAANAAPQMSAMAAVIGTQVAGVLPSGLQTLVAAAVASQQAAAPGAPTQAGQLGSLLSSLSSSIATAAPSPTDSAAIDSVADSALSGLSHLISQISQLSLTAATAPVSVAASTTSSPNLAQTTVYYVQTVTALITSTAVETSITTFCPSAFSSYAPSAYSGFPGVGVSGGYGNSGGSTVSSRTGTDGPETRPCPGRGYTCSDCLDGWFCPPSQTPAAQVPCGYGWPCYHCQGGFFCVPAPQTGVPPAPVHAHSTPSPQAAIPVNPQIANGYQYVGCYQDNTDRSLRDAQLLSVAGGMTNGQCVDYCRTQGFAIAGTEDGTQCFCGTLLLDSVTLGEGHCNMSCSGDATNSTKCGGSWALSIWTVDGGVQQAQSQFPEKLLTSATTPGWQDGIAVRSRFDSATSAYALPGSTISTGAGVPASMNTTKLELAILAAVAAEASGLAPVEPASASGIIKSVSMILNMGMSSIASELSLAVRTRNMTFFPGPTNFPLAPKPVILLATRLASDVSSYSTAAASVSTTSFAGSIPVDGVTSGGSGVVSANTADDGGSYLSQGVPRVARAGKALRLSTGLV